MGGTAPLVPLAIEEECPGLQASPFSWDGPQCQGWISLSPLGLDDLASSCAPAHLPDMH